MDRFNRSMLGGVRAVAATTVGLFLMWVGNAATAADDIHGYPFNDRLDFVDLAGDMLAVPLTDVIGSALRDVWFPFLNLIMLASIVIVIVAVALVAFRPATRTLLITISAPERPLGADVIGSTGAQS